MIRSLKLVGDWNKVFVVRFRVLYHEVLHSRRNVIGVPLAALDRSPFGELHETSNCGLGRQDGTVLNDATVFQHAPTTLQGRRFVKSSLCEDMIKCTHDNNILSNVNVGAHGAGRHNGVLSDEHMIPDMQWKEGDTERVWGLKRGFQAVNSTHPLLNCL